MAGLVVLLEQVLAEVSARLAPNGVDVVGVVLRVVQLDQEQRGLNPVIVGIAPANSSRPGEVDIPSSFIDLRDPPPTDRSSGSTDRVRRATYGMGAFYKSIDTILWGPQDL